MSLKRIGLVLLLALIATSASFAAPTKEAGKELFIANCATCHNKNMKDKLTGPPLAGVQAKWGDDKALYAWIRNSQGMIASGNPNAVAIWNEYKPTIMNAFPNLTDEQIASMLLYVDYQAAGGDKPVVDNNKPQDDTKQGGSSPWLFVGLATLLGLLAFALMRIIDNLNNVARVQDGQTPIQRSWETSLSSKGFVAFAVFAITLLLGYKTIDNATRIKLIASTCHDGARRSLQTVRNSGSQYLYELPLGREKRHPKRHCRNHQNLRFHRFRPHYERLY